MCGIDSEKFFYFNKARVVTHFDQGNFFLFKLIKCSI